MKAVTTHDLCLTQCHVIDMPSQYVDMTCAAALINIYLPCDLNALHYTHDSIPSEREVPKSRKF